MARFELSERWCSWKGVDVIFVAARAAVEAGPLDPPICEVVFDEEYDPFTVYTLEEAHEHLTRNRIRSMEIIISHIDEDKARLTLHLGGDRLQRCRALTRSPATQHGPEEGAASLLRASCHGHSCAI